jgi:hypothetical protein
MFGLLTCPVAVCATKPSDLNAMMWEMFITDIRKTRTMDENFNLAEVTASLLRIGGRVHVATSKLEKVLQDTKDQAPPTKSQKASLTRTQESQTAGGIYPGPSWLSGQGLLLGSVLFVNLILILEARHLKYVISLMFGIILLKQRRRRQALRVE